MLSILEGRGIVTPADMAEVVLAISTIPFRYDYDLRVRATVGEGPY